MNRLRYIVTGGLGFVGSAFVRLLIKERPDVTVTVLDAETYAGNLDNVAEVADNPRFRFMRCDITDPPAVEAALHDRPDAIVNFAAETHVDRSILDPEIFTRTNVLGTHVLLEAARKHQVKRYVQVSTDEVYGDLRDGEASEDYPLHPSSPYAASKAGADLQVLAYGVTFDVPVLITRGCNTYGPFQHVEKLIPLFVTNLLDGERVPVYGDGLQIRDWLWVDDHARGVLSVLEKGDAGEIYNLGAGTFRTNLEITEQLVTLVGRDLKESVQFMSDRLGHDRRYAVNYSKARGLGWTPRMDIETGLTHTVAWYRDNHSWWRRVKSGDFKTYYERQYLAH